MSNTAAPPYQLAANALRARFGEPPTVAIVLGSGMGEVLNFLDTVEGTEPYDALGLPGTGVIGHAGAVRVGSTGGVRVAFFGGRVHMYEGRSVEHSVRAVRAVAAWGVKRAILNSAVGSMDPDTPPGSLVRISDHINLMGRNPLVGPNDPALGTRFPDLTRAYDPALGADADAIAAGVGGVYKVGVYAAVSGPSYETPAEIRMLRAMGGDVVGMSLAPEVIAAVHAGLRVVGLCTVSNFAAGLSAGPLSHDEVTEVVGAAAERLAAFIRALVARW